MKKYLILIVLGIFLTGISGCKRSFEKDYAGPLICPTDNFSIPTDLAVTATANPANFASATEAVLITAQFNEVIGWTIRIKGANGALKTYTGTSNQIALSWVGQSDSEPFFQAGTVTVDLILACNTEVSRSVTYDITKPTFLQLPGFMTDFDLNKSTNNNPPVFGGAGSTSLKRVQPSDPAYNTIGASPQGGSFYNLRGSSPTPVWYYANFEVNPPDGSGDLTPVLTPMAGLNSDPSTVYLNFYANSNGVPNSQIQIAILEYYKTTASENVKSRKSNVNLDWTGWKMVSIKLSDIGILDPRKINGIQFGLGAYLNKDVQAEANMDMVIFTNDGPLFK